MKIAIIEDEALIAESLSARILEVDPHIEIIAMLSSVADCQTYFEKHDLPDLFFSDIQLSDGLSFDFFKTLHAAVPVVFVTAYDSYALQAFKANGIDYLLKPFDLSTIEKSINRYKKLVGTGKPSASIDFDQLIQAYSKRDQARSILVNKGDRIIAIKQDEVALVYIADKTTYLISGSEQYRINRSLEQLEEELGNSFFRINRQSLIHRNAIQDVSRYFARKLKINPNFPFDQPLIISKNQVTEFLNWWENGS